MNNPTRISNILILIAISLCMGAAPYAIAGGDPANDLCTDAIAIDCSAGAVTVSGTTVGASFDDAGFCGTSNTAPGVWYSVSHTGLITASTCNAANYDTKLSVYDGGCGALGCVTGNDDSTGCAGFTSEVSWGGDGSESLILVHGFGTATGDFDLTITCQAGAENDVCEDSIGPLLANVGVTAGSTSTASVDEPPSLDCGTSVTAPGVWYNVIGTGNTMTASTCNDGDPATGSADYDTKISVYCDDCETLECVGGQDDNSGAGCADFSTKFSWPTTAGQSYQVFVHGFSNGTGDFNLAILDDGVASEGGNDCDGVATEFDFCADTSIPESVPTRGVLGVNRFALTDGDTVFDTIDPKGVGPMRSYTLADTAGCSCEQIIDLVGVGMGHTLHGCSISVMDDWLAFLADASCGDCTSANGTPGCEIAACETAVCDVDSFCCNVTWDSICANEAVDLCSPDICIALPSSEEITSFELIGFEPIFKGPYVAPSKEDPVTPR